MYSDSKVSPSKSLTEAENENNSNPIDLGTRIVASVKDKNGQQIRKGIYPFRIKFGSHIKYGKIFLKN